MKVEEVETGASRVLREVKEDPGEDRNEQHQPWRPDEPPSDSMAESRDCTVVQVEPGGETNVEQNGGTAHKDVDAVADSREEEALQKLQVEVESVEMH